MYIVVDIRGLNMAWYACSPDPADWQYCCIGQTHVQFFHYFNCNCQQDLKKLLHSFLSTPDLLMSLSTELIIQRFHWPVTGRMGGIANQKSSLFLSCLSSLLCHDLGQISQGIKLRMKMIDHTRFLEAEFGSMNQSIVDEIN